MASSTTARRRIAALFFLLAGVVVVVYATQALGSNKSHSAASHELTFRANGRVVARVSTDTFDLQTARERVRLRRVIMNQLPSAVSTRSDGVRTSFELQRRDAVSDALRLGGDGGNLTVATTPVAAKIEAPVIKQKLRNNCEATALQILLRTAGKSVSQLDLQAQLPKSGSLDPTGSADSRRWGDPDVGFVGRPDGGGSAGGFGVYPGPVRRLAAKHGVALRSLTRRPAREVYSTLLAGHAVMVWVGLGDGPYSSWQSPDGRNVTVNLNEHTVVLNGLDRSGQISVVNPLTGTAESWSKAKFESMWELLGKRALST